ncbi:MAG: hypothetical protein ACRDTD_23825, partial [Pseudonocardiaceae bacterium]
VPGSWAEKGVAFKHIAAITADDGVFFGSTILAQGVRQNLAAKALTALYNGPIRSFHNSTDDLAGLEATLGEAFEDVTVDVVGTVAVWSARTPRR